MKVLKQANLRINLVGLRCNFDIEEYEVCSEIGGRSNTTIFRSNGRCCQLKEADAAKIQFRPKLMLKLRQLSQHKMNISVPTGMIQKKVQKDEEYFNANHKYSMKRLKKV